VNISFKLRVLGARKNLKMIPASSLFTLPTASPGAEESFVPRHDGLDIQNTFTDEDRNITRITDWDSCYTVPRCVSYSSPSVFLRRNWLSGFTLDRFLRTAWTLEHYRQAFIKYTKENGVIVVNFTSRSAIYQTAVAMWHEKTNSPDPVNMVLKKIHALFEIDLDEFTNRVGRIGNQLRSISRQILQSWWI